jgi:hypothetical protein
MALGAFELYGDLHSSLAPLLFPWSYHPIILSGSPPKMEYYMKRIITYGTFDLLHYGHINLLKRANVG